MSADFETIRDRALSLPLHEQAALARQLWESVRDEIEDEELVAEFERRCAEVDSGLVRALPAAQAMREVRETLEKKSQATCNLPRHRQNVEVLVAGHVDAVE
jgi:putative addiction module component (TIGR02574 family)